MSCTGLSVSSGAVSTASAQSVERQSSLRNDFSRAAWLEEGVPILRAAMDSQLQIGDWALRTPAEASRAEVKELLEAAAAQANCDVSVISAYRTVAQRVPPALRKPGVSYYAYKWISKLSVKQNGKVSDEQSLALRSEFIEQFAAQPNARVVDIQAAVRAKMSKQSVAAQATETVSFKLTALEFASLKALVEAHPVHESIPNFVQELVRNFIAQSEPSK